MIKKKNAKTLLIGFLVLFQYSCTKSNTNSSTQQPIELPVALVKTGEATTKNEYVAKIEGINSVELRPQISGYIQKIFVDEGDFVTKGQILFSIESSSYSEIYKSASAKLASAKIELNRKKELAKSKIISEIQVQQAELSVKSASTELESAKINLNFCTVKAPISGQIGLIPNKVGSLVNATDQTPLTTLSDNSSVNAYFSISEKEYFTIFSDIEKSKKTNDIVVELLLPNGLVYEKKGNIDAFEGSFDSSTGSSLIRAKFHNPNNLLKTGNTGKIIISKPIENAILIPASSTMSIQDKLFVFVVDNNGIANQVPLEIIGKSSDSFIVKSGLKKGDKYIVTGFDRLQSGTKIKEKK
ncbi:efflux RND transporter periplasmic adaptor subunit [Flavobacterium turcicum]|uniref:Efflux RND transporter periplasmic adaptor subunit n=1 Tax=Flavobacterium turcicum TaxID=2764718 RepID=A0ABR7JE75_9FLAO|nr:efflux RND transporter periplasmic adaptor subunit [Flavobacterium turcicum]MBC5862806.1 efflux RND transporter periplasmic adaptor subunit [Flavobacterium turcicum]NHL01538.1 efflux RND transporter periplasmic adaptor subunit [Flavobacterium turcicum]